MSTTNSTATKTTIKVYTPKELADLYGVSVKTLRTWLIPFQRSIGPRKSKYFTARQIRTIFNRIGEP